MESDSEEELKDLKGDSPEPCTELPGPFKTFYITNRMKEKTDDTITVKSRMGTRVSLNLSRASIRTPKRLLKSKTPSFDIDAPYDFDMDGHIGEEKESPCRSQADECRKMYKKLCMKSRLVPIKRVLNQLGTGTMSLKHMNLSASELKSIFSTLLGDDTLIHLDLSGNVITKKEMTYIVQCLRNNKSIIHLGLSSCHLCGDPLKILSSHLQTSHSIRRLEMQDNDFDDNDAHQIAKIIEQNESISFLDLSHNKMGDGAFWIGHALNENVMLSTLDLSWNHIRGHGAIGIGKGLAKNSSLLNVILAWNGFGFEGCIALAEALAQNSTMQILDLTCNRIHPPALFELLKGLSANKTLVVLTLALNPITPPMTTVLLNKIRENKEGGLKELDIKGCVVSKEFVETLSKLQEERLFEVRYDLALPLGKSEVTHIDPKNIFNIDPVRILYFMKEHLRTIDLFLRIDKDSSNTLTREEMRYAFELEGYPISSTALDAVMNYLDVNKDGTVDLTSQKIKQFTRDLEQKYPGTYSEFITGERKLKRKMIKEREEKAEARETKDNPLNYHKETYSQAFEKTSKTSLLPKIKN